MTTTTTGTLLNAVQLVLLVSCCSPGVVNAFSVSRHHQQQQHQLCQFSKKHSSSNNYQYNNHQNNFRFRTAIAAAGDGSLMDDDIIRLQVKARALLEKSKAKLASNKQEEEDEAAAFTDSAASSSSSSSSVPFFASSTVEDGDDTVSSTTTPPPAENGRRRQSMTKFTDEETGLIRADGEKMAELSEKEEWQVRGLWEVFDDELEPDDNNNVYSKNNKQLGERDVAASIYNLRKQLKTQDYERIFDKKNFLIGEDV